MTKCVKKRKTNLYRTFSTVLLNRYQAVHPAYCVCVCVHVLVCSLYVHGKRSMCGPCLMLLLSKPPDEDAFQSDHTTQMLRLAWGNHTLRDWRLKGVHHHWAQSKFFSNRDETGKICTQISRMLELHLAVQFLECGWMSLWCCYDKNVHKNNRGFCRVFFFLMSEALGFRWWAISVQVPTYLLRSHSTRKVSFKSDSESRSNEYYG